MNKTALGAIAGAALLGVSKKLGSKSEATSILRKKFFVMSESAVPRIQITLKEITPHQTRNGISNTFFSFFWSIHQNEKIIIFRQWNEYAENKMIRNPLPKEWEKIVSLNPGYIYFLSKRENVIFCLRPYDIYQDYDLFNGPTALVSKPVDFWFNLTKLQKMYTDIEGDIEDIQDRYILFEQTEENFNLWDEGRKLSEKIIMDFFDLNNHGLIRLFNSKYDLNFLPFSILDGEEDDDHYIKHVEYVYINEKGKEVKAGPPENTMKLRER